MTSSDPQFKEEKLSSLDQEALNKRKENFGAEVRSFRNQRIAKLRSINHWWNISLTVTGITFTLLTTVLGVVETDAVKGLIKLGIGLSGAVAVASQSANSEFRVRGKAGEYTLVEAEAVILEHQISHAKDETELEALQTAYYILLRRTAEAEASSNKED
ncbi:hypothetical protein H6F67_26710 [Microcoleus sp. FACHB-1515]|uniref:hypothetical protein n=1 Tax=Cyanophyceae TaxID=3028117 RepID=UPI0016821CC9|nr:hypothetical protein [Microcoleus sp. FACHB-1515]MBD2093436.1 hypothetical protein [Microcoleus sp. FACHB-1515]